MRKYQTFNSSCAYTGIANLLLRYGINVEDREIILGSNAAFQLLCNEKEKTFSAGYKVQGQDWFNLYLNNVGFLYHEKNLTKFVAVCGQTLFCDCSETREKRRFSRNSNIL